MKITLKILILCFLFFSCNKTTKSIDKKLNNKEVSIKQEEKLACAKKETTNNSKEYIQIKFSNLTISMKDYDLSWGDEHPNDRIYETKQDTVFFTLDPGYMLDQPFKIEKTAFDEIELYGQFEIKTGMNTHQDVEEPLCVLEDWKSYTSKWSKLKIDREDMKFVYIESKTDYPINFTIEELKFAVGKHCGPEWLNEIKNAKSVDKSIITFFLTKYVYKIKAKNSQTNKVIEKYIVFYTPTNC
ncbi:hypothetical protein [Flavobacterium piscisymbiosum]|uniref:Lipoprotein n=1 Tax=Flavobacterium piscisymbiosum TaxID=2893753 RepID=A0ABS8MLJ0_9FLAO|nr:hypothetical protein [Flavobacterium sp. F-30]MCC9065767.1 hypothetical protein [Flavobacterium sp. F-30]